MRSTTRMSVLAAIAAVALAATVTAPAHAASATATITGRAYSDKGTPIDGLTVVAGGRSDKTDRTGKFVITGLKPGTYALEFVDPVKNRYLTEYLGDSSTEAGARTITVAAGEKHSGVSERLTHAALISGVVTVDGTPADGDLSTITTRLTDAAGTVIADDDVTRSTFSFPGVAAGTYTLTASEQDVDYPHLVSASAKVTVTAGQQLNDQRLGMQLVRGVVQGSFVAASVKHVGSGVTITARAKSYASVSGGVVTLKYHRALHQTATVGASGRVSITIPTSSWRRGDHAQLNVLFDGPMGVASSKAVTHFTVR